MTNDTRPPPPYAAIARLVDHVFKTQVKDWNECQERLGPIGNRDHVLNSAHEVQTWLDVWLMTPWAQDMVDRDFQ